MIDPGAVWLDAASMQNMPKYKGETLMSGTANSREDFSGNSQLENRDDLLCPSAQPDWQNAQVFGVVGGTTKEPRVSFLAKAQPVTKELLDLTDGVSAGEVLRIAAPCAKSRCQHFENERCQLVSRTVGYLRAVANKLPPCQIRVSCRWWKEHGKEACFRCPQVVTNSFTDREDVVLAASPRSLADEVNGGQ